MKRFFALMMAMVMAFSVAACGGGEEAAAPVEPTMAEVNNGYVTMMLPEAFSEMQQMEGMIGAGGPGGSVVISDPMASDGTAADVTEDAMLMMAGNTYTDLEMLEYENPADVDGTEAVYAKMVGTNENGVELTMAFVLVFYMLDDVLHDQDICITYQADEGTDLEACLDEIIESIKIG